MRALIAALALAGTLLTTAPAKAEPDDALFVAAARAFMDAGKMAALCSQFDPYAAMYEEYSLLFFKIAKRSYGYDSGRASRLARISGISEYMYGVNRCPMEDNELLFRPFKEWVPALEAMQRAK